jgi:uncharacterized membrane protein
MRDDNTKNYILYSIFAVFIVASIILAQQFLFKADNVFIGKVTSSETKQCDIVGEGIQDECMYLSIDLSNGEVFNYSFSLKGSLEFKSMNLVKGTEVLVGKSPEGTYNLIGPTRHNTVFIAAGLFILVVILVTGKHGIRSIISLITTMLLIFFVYVPGITRGQDPLLLSLVVIAGTLFSSMFIIHGFNKKIISASIGIVAALVLTAVLSSLFITDARLSGFTSEEAYFLVAYSQLTIDMHKILIGTILLATLGLLDDATVTQAGTVFALKHENIKLTPVELFNKAMKVGRDHVASLVNTLIIAYTAASLPLILLIYLSGVPLLEILNREVIVEELIRSLVGSIGLILAVPLTTAIAVWFANKMTDEQLHKEVGEGGHHHGHSH